MDYLLQSCSHDRCRGLEEKKSNMRIPWRERRWITPFSTTCIDSNLRTSCSFIYSSTQTVLVTTHTDPFSVLKPGSITVFDFVIISCHSTLRVPPSLGDAENRPSDASSSPPQAPPRAWSTPPLFLAASRKLVLSCS